MNRTRGKSAILFGVAVAMLLSVNTGHAQTVDDAGFWTALFARGNVEHDILHADRVQWWFDSHARFFDDTDGFGQSIVRPGLGYQVTDSTSLWLGYAWIRTSPGGAPEFDENRIWQQLSWSRDFEPLAVGLRSRLEQRFLETGSETGWRFRQLISLRRPLECAPKLTLVTWDEVFIHLNDTNWGANGGFDQNRVFVGLGLKADPASRWRVEVGYLNQFVDRIGQDDLCNHLLSINFYRNP
jgi:hypothetical protein